MTSETSRYIDQIPEYLQGLLDQEARRSFEKELQTNGELRRELDEFIEFTEAYHELDATPVAPSEEVYRKIEAAIAKDQEAAQHAVHQPPPVPSLFAHLLSWWQSLKQSAFIPWGLAAAQAVVIVILLIPSAPPTYDTLSSSEEINTVDHRLSFNVIFKETATEAEMRALLLEVKGSVVSGPSVQGRYIVTVPGNQSGDEVAARLSRSGIVTFIEPSY